MGKNELLLTINVNNEPSNKVIGVVSEKIAVELVYMMLNELG